MLFGSRFLVYVGFQGLEFSVSGKGFKASRVSGFEGWGLGHKGFKD